MILLNVFKHFLGSLKLCDSVLFRTTFAKANGSDVSFCHRKGTIAVYLHQRVMHSYKTNLKLFGFKLKNIKENYPLPHSVIPFLPTQLIDFLLSKYLSKPSLPLHTCHLRPPSQMPSTNCQISKTPIGHSHLTMNQNSLQHVCKGEEFPIFSALPSPPQPFSVFLSYLLNSTGIERDFLLLILKAIFVC